MDEERAQRPGGEVGRAAHVGDHGARGRVVPLGRGEEVALSNNLDLCSLHQEPAGRVGLEPGGRDCVVVPRRKGVFRIGRVVAAHLAQLRDRALIGTMVFSFARISAVLGMKVEDYYQNGKRWWIRLHEKGGKFHEVPANHKADACLDAYLQAAGVAGDPRPPLFRSANGKTKTLTEKPLRRNNALDMIRRRALAAGLSPKVCCHAFRATGITAYLENAGPLKRLNKSLLTRAPGRQSFTTGPRMR